MGFLELFLRLGLSLIFGLLVGIERQWHHKNAGIKTFTLVSIGSAAFAISAVLGFGSSTNVPTQLAAGVATGIGFIGAGVILRRAGNVQGINTAATLWATTSMGLAIGAGHYVLALSVLVAILIVQVPLGWAAKEVDKRSGFIIPLVTYHLSITFNQQAADPVRSAWSSFSGSSGVSVVAYAEKRNAQEECLLEASFQLSEIRASQMPEFGHKLSAIEGVTSSEWSQTREADSL